MKKLELNGHKLEIYDSIEELPVIRYHKFNKLMLIDAHIGADITEFDAHVERVIRYIRSDKKDLAEKELANLRQNVFFMQTEVSPKYLAFATIIKSVDGKEVTDLSDDSIKELFSIIAGASVKEFNEAIEDSKKKLNSELQLYFPNLFDSADTKEYYTELKKRTLLLLDLIISGDITDEQKKELEELTNKIVLFSDPLSFSGQDNAEIQHDKQFEDTCLLLSQHLNIAPKTFTVLEYYNALFYLREQFKTKGKKLKNK